MVFRPLVEYFCDEEGQDNKDPGDSSSGLMHGSPDSGVVKVFFLSVLVYHELAFFKFRFLFFFAAQYFGPYPLLLFHESDLVFLRYPISLFPFAAFASVKFSQLLGGSSRGQLVALD